MTDLKQQPLGRLRVFAVALAVVLAAAAAEIAARILCHAKLHTYGSSFRIQGDSRLEEYRPTVWRNRPSYLAEDGRWQYNEHGFRVMPGEVRMPAKDDADFWVFLLGGSAMAGCGALHQSGWEKFTGIHWHPREDSIDGQLERLLRSALPDRKVRVFNAATPAWTVVNSRLCYENVIRQLKPDWVVSMDGVNDIGDFGSNERQLWAYWDSFPLNRWPYRQVRLLMRNSAALYLIGSAWLRHTGQLLGCYVKPDEEFLNRWAREERKLPSSAPALSPSAERAANEFLRNLAVFHRLLAADRQPHLLLVQPHLSLREPDRLGRMEKTLLSYYYWGDGKGPRPEGPDPFMSRVHRGVMEQYPDSPEVAALSALNAATNSIFIDTCHFTAEANELIARELAESILSNGRRIPFRQSP